DLLWILYLSAFCSSALAQFLYPAENAFLPTLVEEVQLVPANALNNLNNHLSRLIGPALGGVLMASAGFGVVVALDAATFLIAALLVAAIRVQPSAQTVSVEDVPKADFKPIWREWWAGVQIVRQNHTLSVIFVLMAITSIGEGAPGALSATFR